MLPKSRYDQTFSEIDEDDDEAIDDDPLDDGNDAPQPLLTAHADRLNVSPSPRVDRRSHISVPRSDLPNILNSLNNPASLQPTSQLQGLFVNDPASGSPAMSAQPQDDPNDPAASQLVESDPPGKTPAQGKHNSASSDELPFQRRTRGARTRTTDDSDEPVASQPVPNQPVAGQTGNGRPARPTRSQAVTADSGGDPNGPQPGASQSTRQTRAHRPTPHPIDTDLDQQIALGIAMDDSAPSNPLPTFETPIPGTDFSGPYLPSLFSSLRSAGLTAALPLPLDQHFSHLACSYLSSASTRPPTMIELKKHAQALCLLISTLGVHDEAIGEQNREGAPSAVLDFLPQLLEPYDSNKPEEKKPIKSLGNTCTGVEVEPQDVKCEVLALPASPMNIGRFLEYACRLLEVVDRVMKQQGGLLSVLPQLEDEERRLAESTILGQLISWAQALVTRVAALEREVVALRHAFGGRQKDGAGDDGQEERNERKEYKLTGLSASVRKSIGNELDQSERIVGDREQTARDRGLTAQSLRRRPNNQGEEEKVPDNVIAWIECTSRIYRVQGQEMLYIVPAWDVRPGAEAVRAIENTPLVMSVAYRGSISEQDPPSPNPHHGGSGGPSGPGDPGPRPAPSGRPPGNSHEGSGTSSGGDGPGQPPRPSERPQGNNHGDPNRTTVRERETLRMNVREQRAGMDQLTLERDQARNERDRLREERDQLVRERDRLVAERA